MKGKFSQFIIKALASGFGLGYAPFAPGTFGTLLGVPLAYALHYRGVIPYLFITVGFVFFACIIAEWAVQVYCEHDCQIIVIDEVAGYLVTMAWIPVTWQGLLAGFVLFRVFDALKPGPIGYLDRKIKGGLGVVVDDVAAGIFANIILQLIYANTTWLGAQLPSTVAS